MQLIPPARVPRADVLRTYRHGSLGTLIWFAILGALPVIIASFLLPEILSWPGRLWQGVLWLAVGPVLMLAGLLWLLVVQAFAATLVASMRGGNWVVKVTTEGLYLNLRSHPQHHEESDEPTVAFLDFDQIASAGRVQELVEHESGGELIVEQRRYLQLNLDGVATEPLQEAVRMERARTGPERSVLGFRARSRADHVPVFVPERGVVRVDWKGDMLSPLEGRVPIVDPTSLDRDELQTVRSPEERILSLVRGGDRVAAVKLARTELGLDLTEANRRVDEMTRKSA